jgi:hypothetical protein
LELVIQTADGWILNVTQDYSTGEINLLIKLQNSKVINFKQRVYILYTAKISSAGEVGRFLEKQNFNRYSHYSSLLNNFRITLNASSHTHYSLGTYRFIFVLSQEAK